MKVFVAAVDHRHGTDLYAGRTQAALDAALAGFARQWWDTEGLDGNQSIEKLIEEVVS